MLMMLASGKSAESTSVLCARARPDSRIARWREIRHRRVEEKHFAQSDPFLGLRKRARSARWKVARWRGASSSSVVRLSGRMAKL